VDSCKEVGGADEVVNRMIDRRDGRMEIGMEEFLASILSFYLVPH
jgi:hypothetical protein